MPFIVLDDGVTARGERDIFKLRRNVMALPTEPP
jgi:hypothetical protein